jgi:uncharacterized membrane protein
LRDPNSGELKMAVAPAPGAAASPGEWRGIPRSVLTAAVVFALVGLLVQGWRLEALRASYDQGIFLQVFWNGLRGHFFESTLSSQLSTNVIHAGQLPAVGYHRLGQHFTPALLVWLPVVAIFGPWGLPLVQVGLMTLAGLVLHRLARTSLSDPRLAAFLACSFFAANAVLGPTWGNFTDLCQLPVVFFLLMLGLQQRRHWLVVTMALVMPLIREDTGVLLVGIALWLGVRHPHRWRLAAAMGLYGAGWVVLVTNVLMPLFSEDNSRRFMVENFGHFIDGQDRASSLEVLSNLLKRPWNLLVELVDPPGETLRYLLAQSLPLLFLPLLSLDVWLLIGLPLAGLLLAQGKPSPLSINVRYALLVVPGLFSGAVLWWQSHGELFQRRRLRAFWIGAMALSLLFTLSGNPNRSLSFLIPDSVDPWIYSSPAAQWQHGRAARRLLRSIPSHDSVAATTPLVPLLAQREALVRFPRSTAYQDREGNRREVNWIAMDVAYLQKHGKVSKGDREELKQIGELLPDLLTHYGIAGVDDGIVVLQRGSANRPGSCGQLSTLMHKSGLGSGDDPDYSSCKS